MEIKFFLHFLEFRDEKLLGESFYRAMKMLIWMASLQDAIEVKIAILVRYAKASADLTEPRNRDQHFIEEKLTVDVPQTFMHKLFTLWLDFPIVSP